MGYDSHVDEIDTCVVGGGVIGLAIGRKLSAYSDNLLILESEPVFGEGISSRHSEVIHAGIYYAAGSLKARLCVPGKWSLYQYCKERNVAHKQLGKIIVATDVDEEQILHEVLRQAKANGVDDLELLSAAQLKSIEPNVKGTLALLSPSTGIIDSHELMSALVGEAEANNAVFVPRTRVLGAEVKPDGILVHSQVDGEEYSFLCRVLINSAGLGAQALSNRITGLDPALVPPLYYCKGNYFALQGKSPFDRLIYPVPDPNGAGLGVHATIDMGGQVKFGPDVEYVDELDYSVSEHRLEDYYRSVRRYFPGLEDDTLRPAYVGIRPKLQPSGSGVDDFVIQGPDEHGINGLVLLYGIESPGLTASLAIADFVYDRIAINYR